MPYILKDRRAQMGLQVRGTPDTAGELNYLFTVIADTYLLDHGRNYQSMNDVVGALENAKLEFVRRVVEKYEDEKIKENGDVYSKENT